MKSYARPSLRSGRVKLTTSVAVCSRNAWIRTDIGASLVAKGRRYWVYAYLFAKKDRANIEGDELKAFRKLADLYAAKTDVEIGKELETKELVEICK